MRPHSLTVGQALAWSMAATLLLWGLVSVLVAARPGTQSDIVALGLLEAVAVGAVTLGLLRVHAPGRELFGALGLRPTHPALLLLGVLLGVVLHVPAESLRAAAEQAVPTPDSELIQRSLLLDTSTAPRLLALLLIAGWLVPVVEEMLVRGALFGLLVRGGSRALAVAVTTLCFLVLHLLQWRNAAALVVAGAVLGVLRAAGGSLLPAIGFHVAFNVAAVAALRLGLASATRVWTPSPLVTGMGWVLASGLLGLVLLLAARSPECARARAEDEA